MAAEPALALEQWGVRWSVPTGWADVTADVAMPGVSRVLRGPSRGGLPAPSAVLCGSGNCASVVSGKPVYFDNSHLAYCGKAFWAEALAAQLKR